jgi:3-dehydroquinate synthase
MSAPVERRVRVELGERSYDVVIGSGLLERAGSWLEPLLERRRRLVVVTDPAVAAAQLARLKTGLGNRGADVITVPAGEATKSWGGLERLLDGLLGLTIDRRTLVLALGGGVVGDLAGFAAAIALRGLDFVQLPTSLLAQVDSSVGGKTAINTAAGKNLVGSFYQPRLVLADVDCLDTLPVRELRAGYAEMVKHAVIADRPMVAWFEQHGAALIAGDAAARMRGVEHSCVTKAAIVGADEREGGVRAHLNFGHTFGHALEAATGFGDRLLHGEAVALGMVMAMRLSERVLGCPPEDTARLVAHLAAIGLPTRLADVAGPPLAPAPTLAHMAVDKKAKGGRPSFILAPHLGDVRVVDAVEPRLVEAAFIATA